MNDNAVQNLTQDFFTCSSALLCVLDHKGVILRANPAWKKHLGLNISELEGKHFLLHIHLEDKSHCQEYLYQARSQAVNFTSRWCNAKNEYHWLHWDISAATINCLDQNEQPLSPPPVIPESQITPPIFYATAVDITTHIQSKTVLHHTEERFRLAMQGANHGLWDWNLQTNEIYFSPRWKSLMGYREDEIANHLDSLLQQVHPNDFAHMWATIESYLDKHIKKYESIYRLAHKDGSYRWVLAQAAALWDDNDVPYRMVGTYVDITEHKQTQDALQESEELLAAIFNVTKVGLSIIDEEGYIVRVNPAYSAIYGYQPEELIGRPATFLVSSHQRNAFEQAYYSFLDKGKPALPIESHIRNRMGRWIDLEINLGRLVQQNDNRRFVVIAISDVTQRRKTEVERNRLFNLSVDMQSITDFNGFFKEINIAWERTLGWDTKTLLSHSVFELVHPEDKKSTDNVIQQLRHGQTILNFENRCLCKNGNYRWLSWNIYPLVQQQRLYSITRDITEKKLAQEKIEKQQNFIRLIVDSIPNLIFVKNQTGKFIFANQAFADLLSISIDDLLKIDKDVPDYVATHPFFHNDVEQKVIENQCNIAYEENCINIDGREHYFHIVKKTFVQNDKDILVLTVGTDITRRKNNEEALRESEEKLRIVTSGAPIILFALDTNAIINFIRGSVLTILGIQDDQLTGISAFHLCKRLHAPEHIDYINAALQGETSTHLIHLPALVLETTYTPLFNESHQVIGVIGVSIDVTQRHHLEKQLKETIAELETIFNSSMIGIAYIKQKHFVRVNNKLERLLGYHVGELVKLPVSHIFPSTKDYHHVEKRAAAILTEGKNYDAGHLIKTKQNKLLWCRLVGKAVDKNHINKGSIWMLEDITLQKEAAQNLRLTATIFETTADGIFVTDLNNNILRVNPAFTKITGYSFEDVRGKKTSCLSSGRHDKQFYLDIWQSIQDTGHWQGEIWNRKKSGEVYVAWLSISAIKDENNEDVQYMAVLTDISGLQKDIETVRYLANYDFLTGLPNRMLFHDNLLQAQAWAKRHKGQFSLLFIDLDGFKPVNDKLGHAVGDQILQRVATRLKNCVRETDTVARLGGDEFTIILTEIACKRDTIKVADKIIKSLKQPFLLQAHTINISTSIGISCYPDDSRDVDTLLEKADLAMYKAKSVGKGQFCFYYKISSYSTP